MIKDKNRIKSILLVTLSNLGDIILTTPVLKRLYEEFPEAKIDVITGSPGQDLFSSSPFVRKVIVSKRKKDLFSRVRDILELRKKHYDLVIDLKNSLFPYLLGARFHSRLSLISWRKKVHKKEEHLGKLKGLIKDPYKFVSSREMIIPVSIEDEEGVSKILREIQEHHLDNAEIKKIVAVNPGAKSHLKRWSPEKFAELIDRLFSEQDCEIMLIGNENDIDTNKQIKAIIKHPVKDLTCKTSLGTLFSLMEKIDLCITNDSAPLHVASASMVPTIALFGPTDEKKYGPLSPRNKVVAVDKKCRPCEKAQCKLGIPEGCIQDIMVNEVFDAAKEMLDSI